jgi:hypothetical protein
MQDKILLKKLFSDPRFIPFNDKFDYNHIQTYIKENKDSFSDINLVIKSLSTIFFNQYYKEIKENIDNKISEVSRSKDELVETFIALLNRDTYLVKATIDKHLKGKKTFNFSDLSNLQVESDFTELGHFNLQGVIEAKHDGLNMILNQLSKTEKIHTNINPPDNDLLEYFNHIIAYGNIFSVIKFAYDSAIWDDYYIDIIESKSEIKIKNINQEAAIIKRVGEERLEMNIVSGRIAVKSNYSENGNFKKIISKTMMLKRKPKRIKKVEIVNNILIVRLADGFDQESISNEMMIFAELSTYYNFIKNEILPNFSGITLHDLITIFSEIQTLLNRIFILEKLETKDFFKTLNLYKITIPKTYLIDYLYNKLNYSKQQIKEVINLMIYEKGTVNIWEQSLIAQGANLLPIILPTISPNSLRLVDYWLEKGGFDLDARGKLFENHIKKEMKQEILKKGFSVNIPKNNIFLSSKKENEEIDLIIELKTIIIIAEIKCIKFPFEPRDFHNMLKRLKTAASQIKRKTKFVSENIADFTHDIIDISKKIIPLIITNYPLYSGTILDEVPVLDYFLLEHYVIYGHLNKSLVAFDGKKMIKNDNPDSIIYYKTEDQFSDFLLKFLPDPIPVKEIKPKVKILEKQLSPPGFSPKIIMEYTELKDSIKHNSA